MITDQGDARVARANTRTAMRHNGEVSNRIKTEAAHLQHVSGLQMALCSALGDVGGQAVRCGEHSHRLRLTTTTGSGAKTHIRSASGTKAASTAVPHRVNGRRHASSITLGPRGRQAQQHQP